VIEVRPGIGYSNKTVPRVLAVEFELRPPVGSFVVVFVGDLRRVVRIRRFFLHKAIFFG
jgi:hypothetical protein